MENSIVPFDIPPLTALIHSESKRRKIVWEATCSELGINVHADNQDDVRNLLVKAVRDFLQIASEKEIESRLAKGTTYILEPLPLMSIVRREEEQGWLQRVPNGALTVVGTAKDKSST